MPDFGEPWNLKDLDDPWNIVDRLGGIVPLDNRSWLNPNIDPLSLLSVSDYQKRVIQCVNHFADIDLDNSDFETLLILRLLEAKRNRDTAQRACVLDDYFQLVQHTPELKGIIDSEYAEKIKQCDCGDPEAAHGIADRLLLDLLSNLGFKKTVEAFSEVPKWYA